MLDTTSATPTMFLIMPMMHRPLPCYKGRQIDNTDLLEAIDQVSLKLFATLALVDSI
jgi:hypothetical protein